MSNGIIPLSNIPSDKVVQAPYCFVCHLEIQRQFKGESVPSAVKVGGNGVLIDKNHLLTSAHNVRHFDPKINKVWGARRITVKPAGGMTSQFGSRDLSFGGNGSDNAHYNIAPGWKQDLNETFDGSGKVFKKSARSHDYAIIKLLQPFDLDYTLLDGIKPVNNILDIPNIVACGTNQQNQVWVFGGFKENHGINTLVQPQSNFKLASRIGFSGGHSGSPYFMLQNGKFSVFAIHSWEENNTGRRYATICDPAGINLLKSGL